MPPTDDLEIARLVDRLRDSRWIRRDGTRRDPHVEYPWVRSIGTLAGLCVHQSLFIMAASTLVYRYALEIAPVFLPPSPVAGRHVVVAQPGGPVDEFADDVRVPGVPICFGDQVDQECNVTSLWSSGHHGTCPTASSGSESIVASECAHTRWYNSTIWSRDSPVVAHMSAFGSASSSSQGSASSLGRPNVSPNYPSSTLATCLTNPSRFVPLGTIGRRMSYSERPSSFHISASRAACRY